MRRVGCIRPVECRGAPAPLSSVRSPYVVDVRLARPAYEPHVTGEQIEGVRAVAAAESAKHRRHELAGLAMVATAAVLWGLLGPVARVALREGVAPLELGFWRAAIAGAMCLTFSLARGSPRPRSRDMGAVLGFGVICVALFYAAYFFAVELTGAALAAILLYTAPAWVAVGSFVWLGERLNRLSILAVALTLIGVAAVSLDSGSVAGFTILGIGWGLVAGLTYALYYLAGRRYFLRYGTLNVLAYALPMGALTLLPFVSFSSRSGAAWLAIIFIAVVPTFAAYLIYGAGLIRVSPTRAATVAAIEPLVAAFAAFALWDERFGAAGYLGGSLILAGVFLMARAGPASRSSAAD
jgi:drug/metabolite transporter, DME family